jgi:hypothetical protein
VCVERGNGIVRPLCFRSFVASVCGCVRFGNLLLIPSIETDTPKFIVGWVIEIDRSSWPSLTKSQLLSGCIFCLLRFGFADGILSSSFTHQNYKINR